MPHLRRLGPNSIALIDGKGPDRKVYIAALGYADVAGRPNVDVRRYDDWPEGGVGEVTGVGDDLLAAIIAHYVRDACKAQPTIENKAPQP